MQSTLSITSKATRRLYVPRKSRCECAGSKNGFWILVQYMSMLEDEVMITFLAIQRHA